MAATNHNGMRTFQLYLEIRENEIIPKLCIITIRAPQSLDIPVDLTNQLIQL